ncbi:putative phage-type endonuclease [Nitrosomonas aestuarii]|uniref:Putative phage-type endonuclease n=2 Tax=Nitrosomonas aestuarii TaxID=52441 RepID=A0A1I4B6U8_9PROT|nr:putative phage-type endonuclease [Nitrosomonas aestuarii]
MGMDRKTYIGGADVASVLGVSPWKSAFQLYQEKIGELREVVTPDKEKLYKRGKRLEPVVIEMLIDELTYRGHKVEIINRNERYKDPDLEFIAAEIDLELLVDGKEINGEMKTVSPFAANDWGEEDTDEIPIYYTAQCLHGQMVNGRDETVVAALIGADDLRVHWVRRDEEMIQIIRQKEIEFWNMVQNRIAPEPVTMSDINWLYRTDSGSAVDADENIHSLYLELLQEKEDRKNNDAKIELLTAKIKKYMGECAALTLGRNKLASWKNNKDSKKTDWERAFRSLVKDAGISAEQIKEYVKNSTTTISGERVFRLSK